MTALKYYDAATSSWKTIASVQGPQGPPAELERLSARSGTNMVGGAGANVIYTPASITLTPGRWLVRADVVCSTNTPDGVALGIWNQTSGAEVANSRGVADTCPTAGYGTDVNTEIEMTVTSNTQICPYACRNGGSVLTVVGPPAAGAITAQISAVKLVSVDTVRVPFVTVLPSSPLNGEEVYFQNAAMAAGGIVWHLRYNAASASAYKWEFVGGSKLRDDVPAGATFTNTAWAALGGGPSLTVPLAGDYEMELGARLYHQNAAGASVYCGLAVNGSIRSSVIDSYQGSVGTSITLHATYQSTGSLVTAIPLNAAVTMWGYINAAGSGTAAGRWATLLPRRVG